MSTSDVIKKSVLDMFDGGGSLGYTEIIFRLMVAAILGLYIFFIYKHEAKAAFYSKDLNITMAGLPIVIAALMIAMQASILVSLGMVGALSIVRFRTAIKNPLDLLYVFWAITCGIICGAGIPVLAFIVCAVMTALILVLQLIPASKAASLMVVRFSEGEVEPDWKSIDELLQNHAKHVKEKSRSYSKNNIEVIYELTVAQPANLIDELKQYHQIDEIHFLSHDGEYRV